MIQIVALLTRMDEKPYRNRSCETNYWNLPLSGRYHEKIILSESLMALAS